MPSSIIIIIIIIIIITFCRRTKRKRYRADGGEITLARENKTSKESITTSLARSRNHWIFSIVIISEFNDRFAVYSLLILFNYIAHPQTRRYVGNRASVVLCVSRTDE